MLRIEFQTKSVHKAKEFRDEAWVVFNWAIRVIRDCIGKTDKTWTLAFLRNSHRFPSFYKLLLLFSLSFWTVSSARNQFEMAPRPTKYPILSFLKVSLAVVVWFWHPARSLKMYQRVATGCLHYVTGLNSMTSLKGNDELACFLTIICPSPTSSLQLVITWHCQSKN